jgi:predicted nucleotidyltransferase
MMCETQSSVEKVDLLKNRLGANWTAIKKARKDTAAKRQELDDLFASRKSPDTSVVVFGSVARQEVTFKSDLDWILLIDGPFHDGLVALFLKDDVELKDLTMKYGVF